MVDFMVASKYTVVLEPAEEDGFVVKCLELPVVSQGETKEEALSNIKEAIGGYLEVKAKLDTKNKGEKTKIIVEVEAVTEEIIVKGLPEVSVSKGEKEEIERSVQEMKKGNYVTLEELTGEAEVEKTCKGSKSDYSVEDFRRGAALLEKKLKPRKTKN
jgi:predicted RNase H-like HicB family nuclease